MIIQYVLLLLYREQWSLFGQSIVFLRNFQIRLAGMHKNVYGCLRRLRKPLYYYFTPKIRGTTSVKNTLFIYSREKLINNLVITIAVIVVIMSIKYLRFFVSVSVHYTFKMVRPQLINKYYSLVFTSKKKKKLVVTIKTTSQCTQNDGFFVVKQS